MSSLPPPSCERPVFCALGSSTGCCYTWLPSRTKVSGIRPSTGYALFTLQMLTLEGTMGGYLCRRITGGVHTCVWCVCVFMCGVCVCGMYIGCCDMCAVCMCGVCVVQVLCIYMVLWAVCYVCYVYVWCVCSRCVCVMYVYMML